MNLIDNPFLVSKKNFNWKTIYLILEISLVMIFFFMVIINYFTHFII
ncbi:MAG: hypothetical protein ACJAVY_000486 [Marinoscillum sp.]|jgi:hypothetical protein